MNPYVIIGLIIGWGASLAGAFWFGTSYEHGQEAKREVLLQDATAMITAANQRFTDTLGLTIAKGFQGIRITNTTITNEVRHEHELQTRVLDNPDCNVPVTTWRLLQRARGYRQDGPGTGGPAGGVRPDRVPAVPAAGG